VHPILLDIPALGIHLRAADTSVQLGILLTIALTAVSAQYYEQLDWRRTLRVMAVVAVLVLIGGRIHFLLNYPGAFIGRVHRIFFLWGGAFHIPGGMIALAIGLPWVCRRMGVPAAKLADALVPALGMGIVVARLGCFLEGCCFGAVCKTGWCVVFPYGSQAHEMQWRMGLIPQNDPTSLPVYPLQLYFAAAGLAITLGSLWLLPRKRYDGQVALLALLVFSASSAGLEFLRNDFPPRRYWGPLPQLAWTTLAMTAVSLVALAWAEFRHRRVAAVPRVTSAVGSG